MPAILAGSPATVLPDPGIVSVRTSRRSICDADPSPQHAAPFTPQESVQKRLCAIFARVHAASDRSWDWFQANGGISEEQARQVLGEERELDPAKMDADQPISFRLALLAGEAWRRELLSEAQLARLLLIDRIEVRKLIDQFESEGEVADAAPELRA